MKHILSIILSLYLSQSFISAHEIGTIPTSTSWMNVTKASRISIELDDQVTDGCWVNTSQSLDDVELELIRSGYDNITSKNYDGTLHIIVSAMGWQPGKTAGCVAYVSIEARQLTFDSIMRQDHSLVQIDYRSIFKNGALQSGPKSGFSAYIADGHTNLIKKFIVDINRQKREILSEVNEIENMASRSFWRNYFGR